MRSRFEFLWIAIPLAVVLAVPVLLVWGWIRWWNDKNPRTILTTLSLIGLLLATLSALLAFFTHLYARFIRSFPFYDPTLMKIYAWGSLLSLGGIVFAIAGVWRRGPVRWHALASSVGTLAALLPTSNIQPESWAFLVD